MTQLNVSINETIASGTDAVNDIYKYHEQLDDARRREVMEKTRRTAEIAAEVLSVHLIGSSQLYEQSDELPKWVDCFKQFIHYRYYMHV